MTEFVVGSLTPLQGGSYIGLHREEPKMPEKKKAKTAEVEGLTVKIDVAERGVKETTDALRALADAANAAREAIDKLMDHPAFVAQLDTKTKTLSFPFLEALRAASQ
ncbi:hypothetical protein [Rhizobium rhizogenes]|uniref:hypothetical protein n=1 Tax=Rhizobium rhizogenes TaxID=359 RepID=UPI0015725D53|nr:hypothetical protein [Rhizobium rhizogenes]NTG07236.1 hypothetical protein [Rhizobium rhizogenes]